MLLNFFKKESSLIAVDIGSSSVKIIELDVGQDPPSLLTVGNVPINKEIFSGNAIGRVQEVGEIISRLFEEHGLFGKRVVTAVPGPSVFTRKIKIPRMPLAEIEQHIRFEAANFIPHSIEAVRIDYHIVGESGKNNLEVLVVAVKNEIIDTLIETFAAAQIDVGVVDVDHFALQNMFEVSYPELIDATIGLVNIGERYSSINICRGGDSVFTGDIPVGGRMLTESISEGLSIPLQEASELKISRDKNSPYYSMLKDITTRGIEYLVSEFNRHLSFFWNASGSNEGIDRILLTGGGSLIQGLPQELSEKTGIECSLMNPFRGIETGGQYDAAYLKEIAPLMGICVGLALRFPGDRLVPSGVK
jgi:type IV pilus assembly protein PilM